MKYDIIVIGAGSGGLNIAGFMNSAGFKVLLIDKSDKSIGGDCLNYGCVPSKALLHVAKLVKAGKDAEQFGVRVSGKVDMEQVIAYIREKKEVIREHENAAYFRKKGMDVQLGVAEFVGEKHVKVNGKVHTAKRIVLATGSKPRIPSIKGLEGVAYYTNETIFDIDFLPKKLLVVGGGPIGIELGQAFQSLGSSVVVVQRGPHFLPKEDVEISSLLEEQLKKEGMQFLFDATPTLFPSKNEVLVDVKGKQGRVTFDAVLVSAGRELNLPAGLEKAGIDVAGGKIVVDEYLRTTNKRVFTVGDVAGNYQFTHAAELHAKYVLGNFFSPFKKKVNYDHLSWVTFTSPEIATFGLNEKALQKRKRSYEVLKVGFEDSDRHIVDDSIGKMKLYVWKDKVLGGTMIGEQAGEIVQELILANTHGIPLKKLFEKIYPYPVASRVNKQIVANSYRGKLTKNVKRLLRMLY